jgi:hypothetical protein
VGIKTNPSSIIRKREQHACVSNDAEEHPRNDEEQRGPLQEAEIKRILKRLNVLVPIFNQYDANDVRDSGADCCDAKGPGNAQVGNHGFGG